MTTIRRLQLVCAVLGVTAFFTATRVTGEADTNKEKPVAGGSSIGARADLPVHRFAEDLANTKFNKDGVVTYQKQGQTLFAFPMKPKLASGPARATDYLIMVDTSASQMGPPLQAAKQIARDLVRKAKEGDRVALWTVNTPIATRNLTKGFEDPKSNTVKDALKALEEETPLGDTDLKNGLTKALDLFDGGNRRQAIVFLGDGMSIHNPILPADRAQLLSEMVKNKVAFFSVPLGSRLDPQTLHGFASGTGGVVLRIQMRDVVADLVKRTQEAIAAPILYPTRFTMPAEVAEFYPATLPPLRGDAPTLVVGRFQPGKELVCDIAGEVAGQPTRARVAAAVLEPELDNFFLVNLVEQWKNAKNQPALMRADRALAHAHQLNLLARDELLGQAQMALMLDHVEAAGKLFEQARQLDPSDVDAEGGLRLVALLRDGKIDKEQLRKDLKKQDGNALLIEKKGGKAEFRRDAMKNLVAQAEKAKEKGAAPAVPAAPARDDDNLMKQQRLKQAVEEQHVTQFVDDALRQARRLLSTDPDGANELLKRALTSVRDNPDLLENFKAGLAKRLEPAIRNVALEGVRIKRDNEERLKVLAAAEARAALDVAKIKDEDRMRERMRVYRNLMNQARFEDAFAQGLDILQDSIRQGTPVPVAVTAAKDIGLVAHNLREVQELKRVREERFLLTMMQVERSHVPFPDEPPIQFPPPAAWKRLTNLRKERYESSGLSDDDPVALKKIKEIKDKLTMPVSLDGFEPNTPLKDALGFLSERYNITMLIDVEAFKADLMIQEPENQPVKLPKMVNVSLGTVLRLLLAQAQGTFLIRRDYIEITTPQRQAAEKTIRVYPVADLVTPIPNSVNQDAVNQTAQNAFLGSMGANLANPMMNNPMMMMPGMMPGMPGMPGMPAAGPNGFQGMNGFQGSTPQGLGNGGNLGGQFGLQGGDTSGLLLRLITQVVGKPDDWAPLDPSQAGGAAQAANPMAGGNMGQGGLPPVDLNEGAGDPNKAGSLGYYPPTRALIIKATSRIHTRLGGGMMGPQPPGAGAGAALDRPAKEGALVIGPRQPKPVQVAGSDKKHAPQTPAKKAEPLPDLDAKKIWQDALARGQTEPGLIIATADFLVERGKFEHAAEFLKANLRHGVVARPWVYESLTIALKLSKGSLEEIERAQLSTIDLEPRNADGYLKASRAMADSKRWDRAVAYCRQASLLEPNAPQPYAEALIYAERSKNTADMAWAAGNLLQRDWPLQNQNLHVQAEDHLKALRKILEAEKRAGSADKLLAGVAQQRQRDLVVTLSWQGSADLDLEVAEPIGSVCSFLSRQTTGGGTLIGDTLSDMTRETYVAAEAFPGEYAITLRHIWGRPLGSKATLEVIEHEGTPRKKTLFRDTIVFDRTHTVKVTLKDGRRTSVAQVPAAPPRSEVKAKVQSDRALNQLRALADSDQGDADAGVRGGMEPIAAPMLARSTERASLQAAKISSNVSSGMEMTLQPVVTSDRRVVGMTLNPVFQTLGKSPTTPVVVNPVIPGAGR